MLDEQGDIGGDDAPVRKRPSKSDSDSATTASESSTKTKAAPAKDAKEPKEERTGARQFVREVRAELRKVAWPTRSETLNYSLVVALTLVLLTTLIFCLDWVFSELVLRLFNAK